MASSYTEGLVIELIGSGDKAGSWGDVTNSNLQALNQGISGFSDIDLTGATGTDGSPYIVDLVDAQAPSESTSPSRSSVIRFSNQGTDAFVIRFQTNSAASTRINSIIVNGHASRSLVVGTGTGGTVTIPATYSARVHGDGSGLENSFANLAVDKLALKNNEIISNETNDQIVIAADTVKVGDDGAATLSSNGDQDLILKTGNSTTGNITLVDGSNGDISITPEGSGKVVMDKVNIGGGEIDGTPIGANAANTGAFTTLGATGTSTLVAINSSGNIQTSGNISTTGSGSITAANGLTVSGGNISGNGSGLTGTASGFTAGSVTTNAALTGDVETTSGNATRIASGVIVNADVNASAAIAYSKLNVPDEAIVESKLNISNDPQADYVLTATDGIGGMEWQASAEGDITRVNGGTGITAVNPDGPIPTLNIDSAQPTITSLGTLTGLTVTNPISGSVTGSAGSIAGVTTSNIVQLTDTQTLTNKTLTSPDINTPDIDGGFIDGTIIGVTTPSIGQFSVIIGTGTSNALHLSNASAYASFGTTSGQSGHGIRENSGTLNVKNTNSDAWGQPYHAGMVSGEGAFFESSVNLGSVASGALISDFSASEAHGLATNPKLLRAVIRCINASNAGGYAVGDEIPVESLVSFEAQQQINDGVTPGANSTSVFVHCKSLDGMYMIPSGGGGTMVTVELPYWDIYMYAWK